MEQVGEMGQVEASNASDGSAGPPPGAAGRRKRKPWYIRAGRTLLRSVDRFIARHSEIGDPPVFDSGTFAWTPRLEAEWRTVRRELDEILRDRDRLPRFQDISEDQARISRDDRWKTFFLYGYGYKLPDNCRRCPETTRLIESVPGMTTAFFSILAPGKHIPAHRGPYKGVVRCHLALKVPEPRERCRIRVADRIVHWQEGQSLIFDDTYEHEVWNETDGERVVLFMDVMRPMRFPASLVNRAAFHLIRLSPFVQRARRNQRRWAARN
jgi:beta-hydroxylase